MLEEEQRAAPGRIILVRHGETDANRVKIFADSEEVELTEAGRHQAEELAGKLQARFNPARIFSSAFLRARQTAQIIADRLSLSAKVFPGIQEREFGSLRGKAYREMGLMMKADPAYDIRARWLWAPPGGESLGQVRIRAVAALEEIQAANLLRDVVVVTHGAVMESICAHIDGGWDTAVVPENCGMLLVRFDSALLRS